MRGFRMPAELEAKLAAWIECQPEPKPVLSGAEGHVLSEVEPQATARSTALTVGGNQAAAGEGA